MLRQDIDELEAWIDVEESREPSQERKRALTEELAEVSDFFRDAAIDFSVIGGSGLDLLDGKWSRDHQDLDVAVDKKDAQQVCEAAAEQGFTAVNAKDQSEIRPDAPNLKLPENVFLRKANRTFEVVFEDFSKYASDQLPVVNIENREVRLQRPEINLYHKFFDGRRKDLGDIETYLPDLNAEQRERLNQLLQDQGVTFVVGERTTGSVDELLVFAREESERLKTDLLSEHAREVNEQTDAVLTDLYNASNSEPQEVWERKMSKKYPGDLQQKLLARMSSLLFGESKPAYDVFCAKVNGWQEMKESVRERILWQYREQIVWETSGA